MKHVEIESVESATSREGIALWHAVIVTTDDDGSTGRILQIMPKWIVEARMAEYGCDQPTAIGMALAEPFLPSTPGPSPIHTEPLWSMAATAHVETVAELRSTLGFDALAARVEGSAVEHPTAVMAAEPPRADLVAALRFEVAEVRQMLRDEAAPVEQLLPFASLRDAPS